MQFPKDPKTWEIEDQFMLGDEILVAPRMAAASSRSVYFPMGIWTDLRTNKTYNGRQTAQIDFRDDELPLFVKNGNILPLAGEGKGAPLVLHYFPKLGAEFFLYETDLGDISQFHAAPAADFMRVEVESKQDRVYEWVIHHVTAPQSVREGTTDFTRAPSAADMKPGTWRFDEQAGNLHIRMEGPAGQDRIVNIRF
jgi:alpha-glucosidase (family GH31 glycosyl hydrolase)